MFPDCNDHRSSVLLDQIMQDIELIGKPLFLHNYIDIQWRMKGEEKTKQLLVVTPFDYAAFAHYQDLIAGYAVDANGVRMYQITVLPAFDNRGYFFQTPHYVEIKRLFTGFTAEEIKRMVARWEYDFGEPNHQYPEKRGVVIQMQSYPETVKQTA